MAIDLRISQLYLARFQSKVLDSSVKVIQHIIRGIDSFTDITGRAVSWLTLLMVVLTVIIVVLRYYFESGSIALQESITYLHGVVFMLGIAFTLQRGGHVRVDIFYRGFSRTQKGAGGFNRWHSIITAGVFADFYILLGLCSGQLVNWRDFRRAQRYCRDLFIKDIAFIDASNTYLAGYCRDPQKFTGTDEQARRRLTDHIEPML